jgi:hypothetical protein
LTVAVSGQSTKESTDRKAPGGNLVADKSYPQKVADRLRGISVEKFIEAVGHPPEEDDLERCNCPKAGQVMHWQCGWCPEHDKPRFLCGCLNMGKDDE